MTRIGLCITLVLSLLAVSCAEEGAGAPMRVAAADSEGGAVAPDRKLVRTARLEIEVGDPEAVRSRVEGLIAQKGGFVERVAARATDHGKSCTLSLRVPAEHLDAVLRQIRAFAADVGTEIQEVKDVTVQSIDLDARLNSLRTTEQELLVLQKESRERGSGVEEIMAVHRELTEIRTSIEQAVGQRKALDGQITFATIELTISSDQSGGLLGLSFRPLKFAGACLSILVAVLKFLGYAVIFLIVVALPVGLLIWFPVRFISRWRARRSPSVPSLPTTA